MNAPSADANKSNADMLKIDSSRLFRFISRLAGAVGQVALSTASAPCTNYVIQTLYQLFPLSRG